MVIIATRVCGRLVRNNRLFREDVIMLLSVVPLLARMGLVHVVLLFGTNNFTAGAGDGDGFKLSDLEIAQRELGSQMVLPARIMYALL